MKKIKVLLFAAIAALFTLSGCNDWLDVSPRDKISADVLFADPAGVQLFMANMYNMLPIEDFRHAPERDDDSGDSEDDIYIRKPFNYTDNGGGLVWAHMVDEAVHSEWGSNLGRDNSRWWNSGYKLLNNANMLLDVIPDLEISDADKAKMTAEVHFIKAFIYFGLVKRYGGICLIPESQDFAGDIEALKVPRSTELDSWKAVMAECDLAAVPELGTARDNRRANMYTALALKSRAALHAASVAKYWQANMAAANDQATVEKLKGGMTIADADYFYNQCIAASGKIINDGLYGLYKATPVDRFEAAINIQDLFCDPNIAPEEVMMIKGFTRPGRKYSHNTDIWYNPYQTTGSWPHPGRMNPILDLIEAYETYENPGQVFSPYKNIEATPGVYSYESTDAEFTAGFNASTNYRHFDNPEDLFRADNAAEGLISGTRDARFYATVIYPNEFWKGTQIVIKAGNVWDDGGVKNSIEGAKDLKVVWNNTEYYTYGPTEGQAGYSGFSTEGGNHTRSGFLFKKFLRRTTDYSAAWHNSITDWAEFRYAEVLLNYAEAAFEKSATDGTETANASTYYNDIRRRAGHTVNVTLNAGNYLALIDRERRVELSFENKRYWDLIRRRELTEGGKLWNWRRVSLMPVQDFRPGADQGKWIFVRKYTRNYGTLRFGNNMYYRSIHNTASTGVVQN